MAKISGAEAIMRSLIEEGVDIIYGYPGGAIMPTYDALFDFKEQIQHVLVRHEQAAVHAAEGYARMTGRAGVCLATSGPGATNLVTGIADAMLDSVPLVCITGQVPSAVLGTDAFQETDIISITIPITKWNYQVTSADEIPEIMARAFFIANTGRPGPVLVDITKNAQTDLLEYVYERKTVLKSYVPVRNPDPVQIEEAAALINAAKRPYIFIGHGVLVAEAEDEVEALAERAGIPVASTLHGLSAFPTRHPLYAGMLGMHGNYGSNVLSNEADVIIAVGMRFDDRVTGNLKSYLTRAKIIHIEIDPAEIDKVLKVDVPIIADARSALRALLPLVERNEHPEWVARFAECHRIEHEKIIKKAIAPESGGLRMVEVIHQLSELTRGESVVVADVGQHQMMAARYYRFARRNSWVTSGGLGTMGFALPACFGCKMGAPDRDVVAIIGDGCFQMNIQELATIAQEQVPVKIIVLNNSFLGMVRQWQELFFDHRYSFTELKNPDFVKVGQGFGIESARVSERKDLITALQTMLDFDGPYLLEVKVEKEENVFPMVPAGAPISDIRLE